MTDKLQFVVSLIRSLPQVNGGPRQWCPLSPDRRLVSDKLKFIGHSIYFFLPLFRNRASNALGKRSAMWNVSLSPLRLAKTIAAPRANSQMICLHVPHGGVKVSVSATTASSVK